MAERVGGPGPVCRVNDLTVTYGHSERAAVDRVSFGVRAGATLALVGESGAGKSTICKVLTGLQQASSGRLEVCGEDRTARWRTTAERRHRASQLQFVPQDPFRSIDPRQRIRSVLAEALACQRRRLRRADLSRRIDELLDQVGLQESHGSSTPRELSGGQLQRVAIARALATEPDVVVLDEAVSALDVSVQAQILNLLTSLQRRTGVAYLFITHDLGVVRQIADDVLVLRGGRVEEEGTVERVFANPASDYTRLLIASTPQPGWRPVRRSSFGEPRP